MTYQGECTLPEESMEHLIQEGLEMLPKIVRVMANTAMRVERLSHLGVVLPTNALHGDVEWI